MRETGKSDELATFLNMQLEELLEMADEDILEGVDPNALKAENIAMIAAAKTEAGRRRMAAAKAGVVISKASAIPPAPQVSVAAARAFIESAMNDPSYTLAARSLGDMSDEDVLMLYKQLHILKSDDESSGNGK